MSKFGPKVSKLATIDKQELKRPSPLPGLSEPAKAIWKRIVNQYPPDHFKPQALDLLRMYCESASAHKINMKKYVDSGYEEAKYLRAADKTAARCQGLSVKLGINVNNRMAHRGQGGKATEPNSKRDGLLFGGRNSQEYGKQ
jgi:hypothetical protein